jgi:hypothetical protein
MRVSVFVLAAACALTAGMAAAEARPYDSSGQIQWGNSDSDRPTRHRTARRDRDVYSDWSGEARSERVRGRRHVRTERRARQRVAGGDFEGRSSLGAGGARFSGVGARPRRWCGWWMRTQRGGGPEFNLAWNWRKYGSATSPQVGAVVVWRHHVGEIVGQASNGQWIVRSGNDGGAVRTRARSVSGAIFRI